MTRRRRLRRRLLWTVVLLGLVLLLATVSLLRAGAWVGRHIRSEATKARTARAAVVSFVLGDHRRNQLHGGRSEHRNRLHKLGAYASGS